MCVAIVTFNYSNSAVSIAFNGKVPLKDASPSGLDVFDGVEVVPADVVVVRAALVVERAVAVVSSVKFVRVRNRLLSAGLTLTPFYHFITGLTYCPLSGSACLSPGNN